VTRAVAVSDRALVESEPSRVTGPGVPLIRQAVVEFIGTALLLIAVIGSGIAAQNLSPNDTGLELLENAAATGAALVAIILAAALQAGNRLPAWLESPS
jgi:hypothetical protein